MSTSNVIPAVKHALVEKLHREIVPELERLIQALPDQLLDFDQAEIQLRHEMLKVAQQLLEKWAAVADLAVQRPWDLRFYAGDGLALLTGRRRAYGYEHTERFLSQIAQSAEERLTELKAMLGKTHPRASAGPGQ